MSKELIERARALQTLMGRVELSDISIDKMVGELADALESAEQAAKDARAEGMREALWEAKSLCDMNVNSRHHLGEYAQGKSDGADGCADDIYALIEKEPTNAER